MSWFSSHIINPIRSKLENIWGKIEPQVEADLEAFFSAFAQIALGAVLKQAPLVISGAEKFGEAVVTVIQQAEAKGWQVAVPAVQQLVQQVYVAAAVSSGQTMVVQPGAAGAVTTTSLVAPPKTAA